MFWCSGFVRSTLAMASYLQACHLTCFAPARLGMPVLQMPSIDAMSLPASADAVPVVVLGPTTGHAGKGLDPQITESATGQVLKIGTSRNRNGISHIGLPL
jgi:hypothetical protein